MYEPKVNDYVQWKHLEGWIYYIDDQKEYLTLEVGVKIKDEENIDCCPIHRKYHCLVLCYYHQWNELKYVKSRKSIYDEVSS